MARSINFSYTRIVIDTFQEPDILIETTSCILSLVYSCFNFSNQTLNQIVAHADSWITLTILLSDLFTTTHNTIQSICPHHQDSQVCATYFMSHNNYKKVMLLFLQLFVTSILSYDILSTFKIINSSPHPILKMCSQIVNSGLLYINAGVAQLKAQRGVDVSKDLPYKKFIPKPDQTCYAVQMIYQEAFINHHKCEYYKQITLVYYFILSAAVTYVKMTGLHCEYSFLNWNACLEKVILTLLCIQNLHQKIRFTGRMNQIKKRICKNIYIPCHTLKQFPIRQ